MKFFFRHQRFLFTSILIGSSLLFFFYAYYLHKYHFSSLFLYVKSIDIDQNNIFDDHLPIDENQENTTACRIPKLNPWDPTILENIDHPDQDFPNCRTKWPPDLIILNDDNGSLSINQTELFLLIKNRFNKEKFRIDCFYITIDITNKSKHDDDIKYGRTTPFFSTVHPDFSSSVSLLIDDADFILINCYAVPLFKKYSYILLTKQLNELEKIYSNIYFTGLKTARTLYARRQKFSNNIFDAQNPERMSIHVLILESASASSVRRHLPKMYEFLTKNISFGGHIFSGFNKVADNSQPNFFPQFAGLRIDTPGGELNAEESLDRVEFVWKKYAKNGYVTSYNEDSNLLSIFHFNNVGGFTKKPFDFYYLPYYYAVEKMMNYEELETWYCIGGEKIIDAQLITMRRQMKLLTNSTLQFHLAYINTLTHDNIGNFEMMDDSLTRYLYDMHLNGYWNKSALIIMGDHGSRFSRVRESLVGVLEERLPFLFLRLSPNFIEKYPSIEKNLIHNENRLVSHFDLYETMLDLANFTGKINRSSISDRGQSLLYPISESRTCQQAGIPDYFCSCQSSKIIDPNSRSILEIAEALVTEINNRLIRSGKPCEEFTLKRVLRSESVIFNDVLAANVKNAEARSIYEKKSISDRDTHQHNRNRYRMRILVEMNERNAKIETELAHMMDLDNSWMKKWMIVGRISRVDKYGDQSNCVKNDPSLKLICICR